MDRRTLKRDKQELLDLQLSLKNEVTAKTKVQEDLTQVTSQLSEMETSVIALLLFLQMILSYTLCTDSGKFMYTCQ